VGVASNFPRCVEIPIAIATRCVKGSIKDRNFIHFSSVEFYSTSQQQQTTTIMKTALLIFLIIAALMMTYAAGKHLLIKFIYDLIFIITNLALSIMLLTKHFIIFWLVL
jgi:hypothetical protein